MIKNNGRISLWDNIKFFLIYLVVLGHLANFYLEESWDVKRIFIIIYFFHMPAFIFISGLFSKKTIDQKNYKKVFEYFVLYVFIKIYLFLVKIVCGYGVAEISLLSERGVPWYAFVLAIYVLITICLKNINKKYLFIFSVVISCFAGYDPNIGEQLVLARIIAYYPFFLAGYCIDPSDIASKLRKTKVRIVFLIFSIFFVSGVWIEIKKLYWLAPLLSGQNSYDSLGKMADWGGILRTIYYLIAFALIFALVALAPARKSIISQLGSRSVWVYALHYGAVYLYFGKLGGMEYRPIWIVLVALLVTIICALPFWERLLGGMIRPKWEQ